MLRKRKGNIAAYLVRGAVIALREEDSRMILVEASQRLTQRTAWGMGPASSLCSSSPAAWDSRYSPRSRQVASQTTSGPLRQSLR